MTMPAPLSQSVTAALNAAPTLLNQPGVALGVAQASQSTDQAAGLGQAAAQASNTTAFSQATKAVHKHSSWLGHVFGAVGDVVHVVEDNPVTGHVGGMVLNAMSKPLQEVQHEYRYLHAVWAHASPLQAVLETGAVVGSGLLAGAFLGPQAGILAAEGAGELLGRGDQLIYGKKSLWDETDTGGKYANNISFGRDVASLMTHLPIGMRPNSGAYSVVSGLADGAFDWSADPLAGAGNLGNHVREATYALRSPEQLTTAAAESTRTPLMAAVNKVVPTQSPMWRAVNDMAQDPSASSIYAKYRGISADMAADLAKAKTPEQVLGVWQTHAALDDHFSSAMVPTLTMTNIAAAKARQAFVSAWRKQVPDVGFGMNAEGLPQVDFATKVNKAGETVPDVTAAWRDRLTAYRAYVVNDKNAIDAREVDPAHPNFLTVIRDQALITQNRQTANKIMDFAGQLDTAGRLAVYRQVVRNNVMAMIPPHTEMQQYVLNELDKHLTAGQEGMPTGHFATDINGNDLDRSSLPAKQPVGADGQATDAFDRPIKAAVWDTQTGKVRIPDYMSLVDGARQFGAISKYYGPLDSLAYRAITSAFFKPLALLTPAFANRVAASEALLNALSHGVGQYLGGQFAQRSATLRAKLAEDDYGVYNAIGKVVQAAKPMLGLPAETLSPADLHLIAHNVMSAKADMYSRIARGLAKTTDISPTWNLTAARLAAESGQRMLPDSVTAYEGGNLQTERDLPGAYEQAMMKLAGRDPAARKVMGDDWKLYEPSSPNHDQLWANALNLRSRTPAGNHAAQAVKDAFTPGRSFDDAERGAIQAHAQWLRTWMDSTDEGRKAAQTMLLAKNPDTIDLATRQVKDTIAKTFSPTARKPHAELLNKLAAGDQFSKADVTDIADAHRPVYIEGADMENVKQSGWNRVVNAGFEKVVAPIIDNLSRKSIYVTKVDQQYNQLRQFADKWAEAEGGQVLDDSELWDRAKTRAVESMLPEIHNVYLRSQFSDLSRNLMPFYFAQEQAVKRWGRAAVRNPAVVRRLQLIHHMGKATGVIQQDPTTGQESFVLPLDGLANEVLSRLAPLGLTATGTIPISFRGDMASLNSVAPTNESFSMRPGGPIVAIPLLALQKLVPDSTPAVQQALQQGAQGGFWEQVIPNSFLRNLVKAYAGDNSASYQNAMFDAARAMAYHGLLPKNEQDMDATHQQLALSQLKNWTRIAMILNAVVSATGPAATRVQAGDAKISQEFRDQIRKSGDIRKAMVDFMAKNPNATPYTVFNSDSPLGVTGMPSGTEALNFFNNNSSLFNNLPYAAAWLFPQVKGDQFSQSAYNEQQAFGLRERKGAKQFLQDLYAASADQEYYANYAKYQAALNGASDSYSRQQLSSSWNQWVQDFGKLHPIWYQQYNDPSYLPNARQAVQQLGVALGFVPGKDGKTAVRVQSNMVAPISQLYQQYLAYTQTYVAAKAQGASTTDMKDSWKQYLDAVAQAHPELQPVISHVFKPLVTDGSN